MIVALLVSSLAAAPAQSAQESNLVIVPGRQIGKVRVGMTFAQVKAVLGKPTVVNKNRRVGFGRYVEYDWGWGNWTVGFSGRGSSLRVSLIGTTLRRERTRDGVGVGTPQAVMRQRLRDDGVNCPRIAGAPPELTRTCRLGSRARGLTFFPVKQECTVLGYYTCPMDKRVWSVYEVAIVAPAAPLPANLR